MKYGEKPLLEYFSEFRKLDVFLKYSKMVLDKYK